MDIPGFKIGPVLGEGGMATVYLAEQVSLGRQVALKVMSPTLVKTDGDFCERFVNEGRIIAKLRHQNIVTIYDIGRTKGQYYFMAMEYCPGDTLNERIQNGTSSIQPLWVIRQIASALGYAHKQGFIHRDIKPGNILFRDDGTAVLSDFGIAKTIDGKTRMTRAGWAIGTPEYMSPEQATGLELTPSSDLYSLGIVLYEMLVGENPFRGSDPFATALQHVNTPPPRLPSEYLSLQHLLDGLLAKRPQDRFASAQILIAEIDAIERTQAIPTDRDATRLVDRGSVARAGTAPPQPVSHPTARRIWSALLVGGVLLTLVAAGWFFLRQSQPPSGSASDVGTIARQPGKPPVQAGLEQRPETSTGMPPDVAARVQRLLEVARAHMAVGRYREPIGSNAFEAYSLVLEIDPNNAEAIDGLRRIKNMSHE